MLFLPPFCPRPTCGFCQAIGEFSASRNRPALHNAASRLEQLRSGRKPLGSRLTGKYVVFCCRVPMRPTVQLTSSYNSRSASCVVSVRAPPSHMRPGYDPKMPLHRLPSRPAPLCKWRLGAVFIIHYIAWQRSHPHDYDGYTRLANATKLS